MTKHTFLFVDDDPLFRDLMGGLAIEAFPEAEVVALENATTVAEACALRTFDCVILDHNMPGVSGSDTAKSLHQAFPYLPIILVTGVGDEMLAASALKGGATDYIPKRGLTAQSMRRTIEDAIQTTSRRRTLDAGRDGQGALESALAHDNLFRFAPG